MKVTIVHKDGCTLCDAAIREFSAAGHEIELLESLMEIADPMRKARLLADMTAFGGDMDALPNVFIYDRYIPWKPKGSE